jgi:glucose-6-phosphate dehydrogenase assembly protein OpcA
MSTAPEVVIAQDDAGAVAPNQIESVLQTLWRQSSGEESEASVVQVRTLNLLAFVPQSHARPELMRTIEVVSVQHPGRTITMLPVEGPQEPSAYAAIACRFGSGGKQFCGEQITITSGDQGAPLPSITAALLVAGVPTFLWWQGDPPFNGSIFKAFVESADRVIVDSRTWDTPLATLRAFDEAVRSPALHSAYTDLQWTALTPWRRLTAQCFDLPDARPHLDRIQQVTIECGGEQCDRVAGLLFIGWLASRLGWTVLRATGDEILLQSGATTITVTLRSHAGEREVRAVRLSSDSARVEIVYVPSTDRVQTEITLLNAAPIQRMSMMARQPLEQVVSSELNLLERDLGFETALHVAAQLTPPAA